MQNIAENATNINDVITKLYYPAGAYNKLILNFNLQDLLVFIGIHLLLFAVSIFILGKVYFKINSGVKAVKTGKKNTNYKIRTNKPIKSLIKKELNRFINSPVFVTNTGFGLVLFVVGCVLLCMKFDSIVGTLAMKEIYITVEQIKLYIPIVLFGLICFASFMSSITSSMISLEGKSFNILKSLPIKPFKIVLAKVLTAVLIMLPFILIGDLIVFIRFNFSILEILTILASSIVLPIISETIGILVNLKYPKMDAENDTEVVKQSMSSTIAVFIGMLLTGGTIYSLIECLTNNLPIDLVLYAGVGIYTLICIILLAYLNKKSVKEFNKINV